MFKITSVRNEDELRADLELAARGFGIYGLAMVLIQLHVPALLTVPALLALSGVCVRRWLDGRATAVEAEAAA